MLESSYLCVCLGGFFFGFFFLVKRIEKESITESQKHDIWQRASTNGRTKWERGEIKEDRESEWERERGRDLLVLRERKIERVMNILVFLNWRGHNVWVRWSINRRLSTRKGQNVTPVICKLAVLATQPWTVSGLLPYLFTLFFFCFFFHKNFF